MKTVDYFVEAREDTGEWGITGPSLNSIQEGLGELSRLHEAFPSRELRLTRRVTITSLEVVAATDGSSVVVADAQETSGRVPGLPYLYG